MKNEDYTFRSISPMRCFLTYENIYELYINGEISLRAYEEYLEYLIEI